LLRQVKIKVSRLSKARELGQDVGFQIEALA
jgi:hypothetical protein